MVKTEKVPTTQEDALLMLMAITPLSSLGNTSLVNVCPEKQKDSEKVEEEPTLLHDLTPLSISIDLASTALEFRENEILEEPPKTLEEPPKTPMTSQLKTPMTSPPITTPPSTSKEDGPKPRTPEPPRTSIPLRRLSRNRTPKVTKSMPATSSRASTRFTESKKSSATFQQPSPPTTPIKTTVENDESIYTSILAAPGISSESQLTPTTTVLPKVVLDPSPPSLITSALFNIQQSPINPNPSTMTTTTTTISTDSDYVTTTAGEDNSSEPLDTGTEIIENALFDLLSGAQKVTENNNINSLVSVFLNNWFVSGFV